MNNLFQTLIVLVLIIGGTVFNLKYVMLDKNKNSLSAYYNVDGAFAGFIQKKDNLIRACEFSSNGTILSCSKWFNDNTLKQGQNQGVVQDNI